MPPFSRFATSKYRNQLLDPAKLDKTFTELPSITAVISTNGRTIDCGNEFLAVSLGNSIGLIDWREPRKFGGSIDKFDVGGTVADVQWSGIENGLLGVVTSNGSKVIKIGGESLELGSSGKFSTINFHPHSGGIVSSSTDTSIEVYSLGISNEALSIPTIESSKQHIWSPLSGNQLFSHSTSNIVRTYDPRTSKDAQLELNSAFQINRPSYSALLDDVSLIATGTIPSTRSRSLKLYDLRLPSQPKAIIPFDPASSPSIALVPLVDISRRLAYLIQLHSSSIFAFDFNETNPLPTTLQLPSTIVGATLLPSTQVDVMRAEINRAFVLTRRDEIVPVSVRIERKTYLDFHQDLFPDVFIPLPALSASEWLGGSNKVREKVSLDPEKRGWMSVQNSTTTEVKAASPPEEKDHAQPTKRPETEPSIQTSKSIPERSTSTHSAPSLPSQATSTTSQSDPSTVYVVSSPSTYTRKFLTGNLLHPSTFYTSLPPSPMSTSLHRVLSTNTTHITFPLAGPGGRIAILELSDPGRQEFPFSFSSGGNLIDLALCPYANEIVSATEDGRVRAWRFGGEKVEQVGLLEGLDKVVQVEWHPFAGGLIAVLGSIAGRFEVRLWDYKGDNKSISLGYSAFGFSWGRNGSWIMLAGGDSCVHVIDPRQDGKEIWVGKEANSSSRGFRAIFCGDLVVSAGFAKGSSRQICLYEMSKDTPVARITLDMSPAAFIPHYDDDTRILFLWSKGSRQMHAYHILSSPASFQALPIFNCTDLQNSVAFLPKRLVDVRKVEILQGVRLASGNKIERFGFAIPRNRAEYFQDDIYVPTTDTELAIISAQEWFDGATAEPPTIDLRPNDMIPRILPSEGANVVSQAPSEGRFVPRRGGGVSSYTRVRSEKERESQAMEEMFSKAKKLDQSDDEIEGIPKKGNTDAGYDDDDWK